MPHSKRPHVMVMPLPENMDIRAAAPLVAELKGLRGSPVALDASGVQHLGALCLQVLLAARLSWAADDMPMEIVNASKRFKDALSLSGAVLNVN